MTHPLLTRPCGVCQALVPYDIGCAHWKPGMSTEANRARRSENRSRRARDRKARHDADLSPEEMARREAKRQRDADRYAALTQQEKDRRAMVMRQRRRDEAERRNLEMLGLAR